MTSTSTTIAPLSSTASSHAAKAPYWNELTDVACSAIGGAVLFATDDWFASAEQLVAPDAPRFDPAAFTDWGKWMDGWETRRKRIGNHLGGHDWCVVALAAPARVYGFEVDTAFFTGNQAPRISIQGAYLPHRFGGEADAALVAARTARRRAVQVSDTAAAGAAGADKAAGGGDGLAEGGFAAGEEEVQAVAALASDAWAVMLDQTPLRPGYEDTRHHQFTAKAGASNSGNVVTHLRINIFPDGGVARLRVRGEIVRPNLQGRRIDVAAAANGGAVLGASNAHYGRASNLIAPGESQRMDQGWETARNPNRPAILGVGADGMLDLPASMAEWAIMRLACEVNVEEVHVNTDHFKGNCPEAFELECVHIAPGSVKRSEELEYCCSAQVSWAPLILKRTRLSPHSKHVFTPTSGNDSGGGSGRLAAGRRVTHVRLRMYPDGGIARLRVFGTPVSKM